MARVAEGRIGDSLAGQKLGISDSFGLVRHLTLQRVIKLLLSGQAVVRDPCLTDEAFDVRLAGHVRNGGDHLAPGNRDFRQAVACEAEDVVLDKVGDGEVEAAVVLGGRRAVD